MIFHEELMLSGSIDMIYENPDGTLQIYDWKRCKEIEHETNYTNMQQRNVFLICLIQIFALCFTIKCL